MIEIASFLTPKTCSYLINFFKKNTNAAKSFKKRFTIPLLNLNSSDIKIKNIIKKYKAIRPNQSLINIELIYWPIGEYHDWHDDTIYYDYTTITYLNEGYKGGVTTVEKYIIKPKTGKICLFSSTKKHKVSTLEDGERYVILAWYKK